MLLPHPRGHGSVNCVANKGRQRTSRSDNPNLHSGRNREVKVVKYIRELWGVTDGKMLDMHLSGVRPMGWRSWFDDLGRLRKKAALGKVRRKPGKR